MSEHKLHFDLESRSTIDLKTHGVHPYSMHPTTEILCIAYAVDHGTVKIWRRETFLWPAEPVPPEFIEAGANRNWKAVAHNAGFESTMLRNILNLRHGFPLIPPERYVCTMAASLALGLPAKLGAVADALELTHRKDASGERLMHQMSKPRRPRMGEDPNGGPNWFEDEDRMNRLAEYCREDVEVERELYGRIPMLSDSEQALWLLSNRINDRGFHVDRRFAEAARKIAMAAAPEIDAELAEITGGAVTGVNQIARMKRWLEDQGG
jgi:hypothetical protein